MCHRQGGGTGVDGEEARWIGEATVEIQIDSQILKKLRKNILLTLIVFVLFCSDLSKFLDEWLDK